MIKILVVEDNPINMELTHEILKAQGFIVQGASNGTEAVEKAKKELYNLILMGIGLPDMDGIEVTKIIKGMPQHKDVPVIALTAYAMKGDRERIINCGLDDYISKPIDVPDFTKRIISWVKDSTSNSGVSPEREEKDDRGLSHSLS